MIDVNDNNEKFLSNRKNFSDLILAAGKEGKYQLVILILLFSSNYICAMSCSMMALHKILPDYSCINKKEENFNYVIKNEIIEDNKCIKKLCPEANDTYTRVQINYNSYKNHKTELKLICDDDFFFYFAQLLFVGRVLGMIIYSFISDKYGRKMSYYLQIYIQLICIIISLIFKNKYIAFLVNFLSNTIIYLFNHSNVISSEIMSERYYSIAGAFYANAFSFNGIISVIIMYFFRDWNIILYYHLVIVLTILIFSYLHLTETPLFLLDQNNIKEFRITIKKIFRYNHSDLLLDEDKKIKFKNLLKNAKKFEKTTKIINSKNFEDFQCIHSDVSTYKKSIDYIRGIFGPYATLFNSKNNVILVIKFALTNTTYMFIYYGQLLYVESVPGNIYSTLIVIYLTEIIIQMFATSIINKFKKTDMIIYCSLFSAINCAMILIFNKNLEVVYVNIFFLTSFNSIGVIVLNVYMAECFHVSIKSIGISTASVVSNGMFLIFPYLLMIFGNPYLVYGSFSLLLYFFLKYYTLN